MSHVAAFQTEPGKPLICDLEAVKFAAANLGMIARLDNKYKWWGHHVGDYPLPEGWTKEDMGNNAHMVLSVSPEKRKELGIGADCYELAIIADKKNPGAYTMMYDFYGQGRGLDKVIGAPISEKGKVTQIAPIFMQHYRMCCDALAAKEVGDKISFEEQEDGSWVSYTVPNEERLREKL